MNIIDRDDEVGRWTFGTDGVNGRFGGAHPSGHAHLHTWVDEGNGEELRRKVIKCRSYRRAVRVLRLHLQGHNP